MVVPRNHEADRLLVERCLAGQAAAREQLVKQHQDRLRRSIRAGLGPDEAAKHDVVEDLAQKVWLSLFEKDGQRLGAYDPLQGSLDTYLASVARQQIAKYWRYRHHHPWHDAPQTPTSAPELTDGRVPEARTLEALEELCRHLTATEEEYCRTRLFALPDAAQPSPYSDAYQRKLNQRIRDKRNHYLRED
jgi:RNA polymerase sigma factor (sigma-70 family)